MAFAALATLTHSLTIENDPTSKYFVANPKSLDYKFVGKKDEHRFGVELKENKQFHHTKTGLRNKFKKNYVNNFLTLLFLIIFLHNN